MTFSKAKPNSAPNHAAFGPLIIFPFMTEHENERGLVWENLFFLIASTAYPSSFWLWEIATNVTHSIARSSRKEERRRAQTLPYCASLKEEGKADDSVCVLIHEAKVVSLVTTRTKIRGPLSFFFFVSAPWFMWGRNTCSPHAIRRSERMRTN